MRKLFWLGTFLMVAAALGVFWTAQYAARHPASFLNHCFSAARLSLNWSAPIHRPAEVPAFRPDPDFQDCAVTSCDRPAPETPPARVGDVSSLMPAVLPVDPIEVIQIEQIDPKVAQAIAEVLDLEQTLNRVSVAVTTQTPSPNQGPDQVMTTMLEGEEIELCEPDVYCQPPCLYGMNFPISYMYASHCRYVTNFPSRWTSQPPVRMPYCDEPIDEECLKAAAQWHPECEILQVKFGSVGPCPLPATATNEEVNQEVEQQEIEIPAETMAEETMPPQVNPYHYHQGCPYPHGHCPYPYSRPRPVYHQPVVQPVSDDAEQQAEPAQPGTLRRTSNWFGTDPNPPQSPETELRRFPIHWDREDSLVFPSAEQWG